MDRARGSRRIHPAAWTTFPGVERRPTTYWDYIRVEELLSLQRGLAGSDVDVSNDEIMFIVVHQVDELWMKVALRELVSARDLFAAAHVPEQALAAAVRGLRRVDLVFRKMAEHFALMETLTTRDYLAFRDKLSPASGFQSAGLRELEILMGLPDEDRIPLGHEHTYMQALRNPDGSASAASRRVDARLADRPTLRAAIDEWLYRTPIQGSSPGAPGDRETVAAFVDAYCAAHERAARSSQETMTTSALSAADSARLAKRMDDEVRGARAFLTAEDAPPERRERTARVRAALVFIESYRELPLLAWPREVLDWLVAVEQAFVVFRQRHARMVERVIGRRTGTGGSAGVDYLDQTALRYRIFRDVWAARTLLVPARELPAVMSPRAYGFASD